MANYDLTHQPSGLDRRTRALVQRVGPTSPVRTSASRKLGRGLGWFTIGLGLVELLAARSLARAVGLPGHEALVRAYGLRELAAGIGLLTARSPHAMSGWMRARVAGDALDAMTLTAAAVRPTGGAPLAALAAVGAVTALDLACARTLAQEGQASRVSTDYSDRVGLGGPPEMLRGAALADFEQPPDMRASPRLAAPTT